MHMDLYHDPNEDGISDEQRKEGFLILDMRGLVFDSQTGRLLRRPFEKFFNLGERFVKIHTIDWDDVLALEKLDGSMICPIVVSTNDIVWMTKKSNNPEVDEFVKSRPEYVKLVTAFCDWSCLFEWCSPTNRIVVNYDKPQLILTGMRHISRGFYKPYHELKEIAKHFNVRNKQQPTQLLSKKVLTSFRPFG